MLIYLLFYAFIPAHCAVISGKTVISVPLARSTSSEELSFPPTSLPYSAITSPAKRENYVGIRERLIEAVHAEPERHSVEADNTRDGYERDLMVVLPVMQGNSDLTNSKLQILYTKPPVTAIIGEDSKDLLRQRSETVSTARAIERRIDTEAPKENGSSARHPYAEMLVAEKPMPNKVRVVEKRIDTETSKEVPNDRHPYTAFLFSKSTTSRANKSPLDYGYPESFKFVQELNELPKNHKPEWAITEAPESPENGQTTPKEGSTEGNPFQMYKSVQPYEINKLLAPKPLIVAVTDSVLEETVIAKKKPESTEATTRVKRPQQKRPTKKPQKSKPNPQKLNEDDISSLTSTSSTASPSTAETHPTSTKAVDTAHSFLPTPTGERVAAIVKEILANTTALSSISSTTALPANASTPLGLNLLWAHPETTTTELNPVKIVNEVKPSDLISLSRILGENFQPKLEPPTTRPPAVPDDFLNNDMKNLLLALGIIRSEIAPYVPFTTPRPTTMGNYLLSVFGKREPVSPTVDPLSYVTFKKIPVEYERPKERTPVSDDMKDLLASFGLLPKRTFPFGNSIFGRMSRKRRLDGPNVAEENTTVSEESATVAEDTWFDIDNSSTTEMSVFNDTSTSSFDEELELLSPNSSSLSSSSSSSSPLMDINMDMLPDDMRNTLENLGLILPLPYNYQPHRHGHVFQPTAHLDKLGDRQKIEKINEAIDHIRKLSKSKDTYNLTVEEIEKELENVTALLKDNSTMEDVTDKLNTSVSNATATKVVETLQKIPIADEPSTDNIDVNFTSDESSISVINLNSTDEEFSTELNVVMNPPNPLSPEELQHLLESNKNDIKRQQPTNTSTSVTTTEEGTTLVASSEVSTSSTTESSTRAENNNAPISDLAASFGGGETASDDPSSLDLTSTEKPNGLYFYLDWNTFLTVGEPEKNPVRIRFAPKAGNARNFLPITVP